MSKGGIGQMGKFLPIFAMVTSAEWSQNQVLINQDIPYIYQSWKLPDFKISWLEVEPLKIFF